MSMKLINYLGMGAIAALLPVNAQTPASSPEQVRVVVDVAHGFSFYASWRLNGHYFEEAKKGVNYGNLYDINPALINAVILPDCDNQVEYNARDEAYLTKLMQDGGMVLLLGNAGRVNQNAFAQKFGVKFAAPASGAIKASAKLGIDAPIEGGARNILEFSVPTQWDVLMTDAKGAPVMARKKIGKGYLIVAPRGIMGSHPDTMDKPNAEWLSKLVQNHVGAKLLADVNTPMPKMGDRKMGHIDKQGGVTFHYSDYMEKSFSAMQEIAQECVPLVENRMGVKLSDGMGSAIGLLATGGGGYSSGPYIGLAAFWEGFPESRHGMYEFITHEFTHSWVLPHPEVWNEPIATYVGDLVMIDAGYPEEGKRRIAHMIKRASDIDPSMSLYNIDGKASKAGLADLNKEQALAMHWGKTFWLFEELTKQDSKALAKYFQAKRAYLPNDLGRRYSIDDTFALISIALEKDMFDFANKQGFQADASKAHPALIAQMKKSIPAS